MPKIFISYRRADSRTHAGRLYDRLVQAFGIDNVFMDVNNDNIPLGRDFRGVLRESVARCDVLLALIGKSWLTIADENGSRRLDNPNDFVRIEIESALQRDSCLVIPLTVDGAFPPAAKDLPESLRQLAFNNATAVRDDPDFHPDVNRIVRTLEKMASAGTPAQTTQPPKSAPQSPPPAAFDVHKAVERYHDAFDAKEWDKAKVILNEIRGSGAKIPRAFKLDAHEKDVKTELEAEEREREYNVVRRLARASTPNADRIWEALQAFWESYPDYDPDDLARFRLTVAQDYFHRAQKRAEDDSDGKIADYTEAIRLDPHFAEAYFQRGYIYDYEKQDYESCFSDYSAAIRLNPEHANAYFERSGCYAIVKQDYDKAISDCTEAIRLNPQLALAYYIRGFAYDAKQDYESAITDFTEVIRLKPQYAPAYNYRGDCYASRGEHNLAIADYETTLRIDPNYPYAAQSIQNARDALKKQKK